MQIGNEKYVHKPSQKAQCTLSVNAIPLQQNKRETLLSHFNKFGEVIDIRIPLNSERAFIQFSRREEAEAALMAPDAVMGNRFIKLWWAYRDNILVNGTVSGYTKPPAVPRGTPVASASHSDAISPASENPKPVIKTPKPPPPSQKKLENLKVLKEELRKKQEMLDQKRNDFRPDSTKAETVLASLGAKVIDPPVLKPSLCQFLLVGPSVVTKRFKLDNRPTTFKIIPALPNALADVAVLKEHFSQFGDLAKVESEDLEPADSNNDPVTCKYSTHVYFRNRHSAEKAFSSGKCWNGHNLKFSWLNSSNHGKDTENQLSSSKEIQMLLLGLCKLRQLRSRMDSAALIFFVVETVIRLKDMFLKVSASQHFIALLLMVGVGFT
ncbi:hypothetical protein R6Q57_005375 [Mikania cordata]